MVVTRSVESAFSGIGPDPVLCNACDRTGCLLVPSPTPSNGFICKHIRRISMISYGKPKRKSIIACLFSGLIVSLEDGGGYLESAREHGSSLYIAYFDKMLQT